MRVIIIGSGPAGLTTAHCLLRQGITDVVLLDRRADPLQQTGACLVLWPHSARIMDQLGLLGELEKRGGIMHNSYHYTPEGVEFAQSPFFDIIKENHGYPLLLLGRAQVVDVLFNALPGKKTRIKTGKNVMGVEESDSGVKVTCEDGSVFSGDIVIACDGVHSSTRRRNIDEPAAEARSLAAEYRCIFGNSPRPDGVPPNAMTEVHDSGLTFQVLSSEERSYWLLFAAKDKDEPKVSRRYSAEETEALAQRYVAHAVNEGGTVTFGELWKTKSSGTLYDLEEFLAPTWYKGRVVLVGDAAHKMTPNLAFGGNNAIESAAGLANQLHVLLEKNSTPSTSELEDAFEKYHASRRGRAKFSKEFTGDFTRKAAWSGWLDWFLHRYVAPLIGDRTVINWVVSPFLRDGLLLDYLPDKSRGEPRFAWKHVGASS